jgi:hypothetical protein
VIVIITNSRLNTSVHGAVTADIIKRSTGELWLVRTGPIVGDAATGWASVSDGELVRIPLIPYLTSDADPATAMGFAAQLGVKVMDLLGPDTEVVRAHLALGTVDEVVDEFNRSVKFRFWFGFAAHVIPRTG